MRVELADCENVLLREIADKRMTRADVAMTYAMAMKSSEDVNWAKVNGAILERWAPSSLEWIKKRAWQKFGYAPTNGATCAGNGWWGCPVWLHRGRGPADAREMSAETVGRLVPTGEQIEASDVIAFGPMGKHKGFDSYPVAEGFRVSAEYLDFAVAMTTPDEWRWVPSDRLRFKGESSEAGMVIGVKDGEPVAIIAPIREDSA